MKTSLNRMRRPATAVVDRRAMTAADEMQDEQLQVYLDWATRAQIVCILTPYPEHDSNARFHLRHALPGCAIDSDYHGMQAVVSSSTAVSAFLTDGGMHCTHYRCCRRIFSYIIYRSPILISHRGNNMYRALRMS